MEKNKLLKLIDLLQNSGHEFDNLEAKELLRLHELGQKAEFVKDIVAMANNYKESHIVIGLADHTFEIIGINRGEISQEQLNQIISGKIDPVISVRYDEVELEDAKLVAVITINGVNPPYFVSRDVAHGQRDTKRVSIRKGMSFVRRQDVIDGMVRSDLDRLIQGRKLDVQVNLKVSKKIADDVFDYDLLLLNRSNEVAEFVSVTLEFKACQNHKCPTMRHSHRSPDSGLDKKSNITFDVGAISPNGHISVASFHIKSSDFSKALVVCEVTGKNVKRIKKMIRPAILPSDHADSNNGQNSS